MENNWIEIKDNDSKPPYYKPVIIVVNRKILYEYSRVSDGDNEYYISLNNDDVIYGATHWMDLPILPKVEYDDNNLPF